MWHNTSYPHTNTKTQKDTTINPLADCTQENNELIQQLNEYMALTIERKEDADVYLGEAELMMKRKY